jgi:hypothetical protein
MGADWLKIILVRAGNFWDRSKNSKITQGLRIFGMKNA